MVQFNYETLVNNFKCFYMPVHIFSKKLVPKISDRWRMVAKSSQYQRVQFKKIIYEATIIVLTFKELI